MALRRRKSGIKKVIAIAVLVGLCVLAGFAYFDKDAPEVKIVTKPIEFQGK